MIHTPTRKVLFEKGPIKIKVIQSSNHWWYRNFINKTFYVINCNKELENINEFCNKFKIPYTQFYVVVFSSRHGGAIIEKKDCEKIK